MEVFSVAPELAADASPYAVLTCKSVKDLISRRVLRSHYQPIVDLSSGGIVAHEALVRTPRGAQWRNPDELLTAARHENVLHELEAECVHAALRCWDSTQGAKLFVNFSAPALTALLERRGAKAVLEIANSFGVSTPKIVVELTEHEHVRDIDALVAAIHPLRVAGVAFALDDFGDGRSSLRLWSELRPQFVKIDKYFTRDVTQRGEKVQTWRALLQIAETFGAQLVAEGIEHEDELRLLRDLGVGFGQGYFMQRPAERPAGQIAGEALQVLKGREISVFPHLRRAADGAFTADRLRVDAPYVAEVTSHIDAYKVFQSHEDLHALAILDSEQRPLGLISRTNFVAAFAKPFFKELYGKKSCLTFGNRSPLLVDIHTGIDKLTELLTSADQRYLTEGFILTDGGRYAGLGTGEALVRMVTEARIEAARHANPLTFLPGNIPITDHIERLLATGCEFVAAYADLNAFKPYNDFYGYWRGDDMIRLVARVLVANCDSRRDFVGHVGGDDFVVLFQSDDWNHRCQQIVEAFNVAARELYDEKDLAAGGIWADDRYGNPRFHPITSLILGVVPVGPGQFRAASDVATAAAAAKRGAKQEGVGVLVQAAVNPV